VITSTSPTIGTAAIRDAVLRASPCASRAHAASPSLQLPLAQ
jgi:flavin-binding protein dodecin